MIVCLDIARDYPRVAQWFRSLARDSHFSKAAWTASDDKGYEGFYEFLVQRSTSSKTAKSGATSGQTKAEKEKVQEQVHILVL